MLHTIPQSDGQNLLLTIGGLGEQGKIMLTLLITSNTDENIHETSDILMLSEVLIISD